jgi:hypothetical protein
MSQTQIELKLKDQRLQLEAKYDEMISSQKQENDSKIANLQREKEA